MIAYERININTYYGNDPDRLNLRVTALVHDTFKYASKKMVRNHAEEANSFLSRFHSSKVL